MDNNEYAVSQPSKIYNGKKLRSVNQFIKKVVSLY
jgi:hypothetical protein